LFCFYYTSKASVAAVEALAHVVTQRPKPYNSRVSKTSLHKGLGSQTLEIKCFRSEVKCMFTIHIALDRSITQPHIS
jgi:hypothetical protein